MKDSTILLICIIMVILLTIIDYSIATSDLPFWVKMFWLR